MADPFTTDMQPDTTQTKNDKITYRSHNVGHM